MLKNNFTLVELLVVIAIISILASLLLPTLQQAHKSANAAQCVNNQRQCFYGMRLYLDDYDEYMFCPEYPGTAAANFSTWAEKLNKMQYLVDPRYDVTNCAEGKMLPGYRVGREHVFMSQLASSKQDYINLAAKKYREVKPSELFLGGDGAVRTTSATAQAHPDYRASVSDDSYNLNGRAMVYMAHLDKANAWFYDGHVGTLDYSEIRAWSNSRFSLLKMHYGSTSGAGTRFYQPPYGALYPSDLANPIKFN